MDGEVAPIRAAFFLEKSNWLNHWRVETVVTVAEHFSSDALFIPDTIRLIPLPTYSPELNPVGTTRA